MRAGDIIEYHEYFEYKFVEGVIPKCAGEVLELLCDVKDTLVGFKLRVCVKYDFCFKESMWKWTLCEPIGEVLKFGSWVPPMWEVHQSFESFLERNPCA